jgi:hypothetical protein
VASISKEIVSESDELFTKEREIRGLESPNKAVNNPIFA